VARRKRDYYAVLGVVRFADESRVYVFVFRRADRLSGGRTGTTRGDLILALTCGIATAVVVSLVFQELFFVRLP